MEASDLDQMGPIDYIVVEWPGKQPTGEAAPLWSTWSTAG